MHRSKRIMQSRCDAAFVHPSLLEIGIDPIDGMARKRRRYKIENETQEYRRPR